MECPYCKAENRDGVRYCGSCGKLMGVVTPAPLAVGGNGRGNTGIVGGPSRSLTPGARLQGGRYVVKRVLGQGGMGAALLTIDIRLDNKLVVIKELISNNNDASMLREDVRDFKREVSMLAHIDHPLIPNVTDHFQEGLRYYMVQEYIEGETLEEHIDRTKQPMKEREALIYASEVLDVLDYLSQQTPSVVHRDIKPANIIIGAKDRRVHLVDFGIARADVARNERRWQTSALGTPGYAPPEQYQGNADPRSDLYALAATLHHLLTNRDPRDHPPFTYPAVRALNSQLSSEIERVLIRALNNDINLRYQSAAAMKQEIDAVLRNQFGVSGFSNSYMLGNPGTMARSTAPNPSGAVPAVPIGRTISQQPTLASTVPQQLPPYPGQSPMTTDTLSYHVYNNTPQRFQRRGRLLPYLLLLALLLLLIFSGVFAIINYLPRSQATHGNSTPSSTGNGIGVTKVGNDVIGVSDGSFAFDTARADGTLKQQAANQLKQKSSDSNTIIASLTSAIDQDPNDGEAHIYLEDQRVISSGAPYVTIVVGTMLSQDNIGVGRNDLQGAYVAQKEFNDGSKLNRGVKVRLLVASSGSDKNYATSVAKQIVQLAKSDKTFVGVMGWPFSARSVNAIGVLGAAHIPMLSQTSSSDALTHISQYFFRVVPSNKIQGVSGAKYAEQILQANTAALFVDPTDPYSQSLANDFSTQFEADSKKIVVQEKYTVGKTDQFSTLLQDALSHNPGIIYFSGYAADISTLLTNLPAGNPINVMGGDALYELNGYQSSASAGFTHLHFTAFAYPDEWDVLGQGARKPAFFSDYSAAFSSNGQKTGYGYTRADNDVALSYDATVALLNGCNIVLKGGKQQVTPEDLRQALTKTVFQGVSGQVSLGPDGDPVNKAIVILSVDPRGRIRMELPVQGQFFK